MSLLDTLRNKYLVTPGLRADIAKSMLEQIKSGSNDIPYILDVPIGFNMGSSPSNKRQLSGVDFLTLRQLSISHETVRAAINVRKRQITGLEWEVVDDDATDGGTPDIDLKRAKNAILELGDGQSGIRHLLDLGIEDLLVLDALGWYKQRNKGGKLIKLIPIDTATIKLRVDENGSRPLPPEIAFEQWIRSTKVAEMTTDDLIYEEVNPRTSTPYGLSPLESLILSIDASLQAMLYNINYLNDNNVPQGFLGMPESWTINQIKEYKDFFDGMLSGSRETSKLFPTPAGTVYTPTTKPADFVFKDFFDYLDRRICMMFDVTPQELGISLQQYKENAEGQDKIQMRKGIKPLAQFISAIFTNVLKFELGYPGLKMQFVGIDNRFETTDLATLIPIGVIGIDEAREDLRLPLTGMGPAIIANGSITPIDVALSTTVSGTTQVTPNPPVSTENTDPTKPTETAINAKVDHLDGIETAITKALDKVSKNTELQDIAATIDKIERDIVKVSNQSQVIDEVTSTLDNDLTKWERKAIKRLKDKGDAKARFYTDNLTDDQHDRIAKGLSHATTGSEIRDVFKFYNDPKPKSILKSELRKRATNILMERLDKSTTYARFKSSIYKALFDQLKPFTEESTISKVTDLSKADGSTTVTDLLNSLDIQGLLDYLNWAGLQGGNNALEKVGVSTSFDITNPKFTANITDREKYLITSVDSTTKDWLVQMIAAGKEAQLSNSEIAGDIADQIDEIARGRAETIVNTEVANAAMQAELSVYSDQGIEQKIWVLSEDIGDECGDNADAGAINVDDSFPSGDDAPPAHPNCRCYLDPVIADQKSIGELQQENQDSDLTSYENAINSSDTQTLKDLAAKYPGDTRYHVHELIPGLT